MQVFTCSLSENAYRLLVDDPPGRALIGGEVSSLTISGNGQAIGYATVDCPSHNADPGPGILAVTSIRTGKTKQWTIPPLALAGGVSLSADASLLGYGLQDGAPAIVRVLPTSSAPGPAAHLGRTIATVGPEFLDYAAISADDRFLYYAAGSQVCAIDLATGSSHVVYTGAFLAGFVTSNPSGSELLLEIADRSTRLAVLSLATGAHTYLPSSWLSPPGDRVVW
jgi:hypothetical protein